MKTKAMKPLTVSLALLLAGSLLTGCGKSAEAEGKEESGGKVQVKVWYSGGKTAANVFEEIIQEFNSSQDTYEAKGVVQADYDETYEKLQAAIAGKKQPNVVLLDADKAVNLAEKGLLEDLNPFLEKDEELSAGDFIPVFYKQGVLESGELFAIPAYGTTQVMYYNIEAFQKAGIEADSIKTWQDLAKAAERMTVSEGGKTTFYGWEPMYNEDNLMDAVFSNGGTVFSEDGKTVQINSEEWVEVWEAFRQWIHEDQIMRIHYGGQGWQYWYDTMDDVLQNRAGGYTGSSGDQADLDFSVVAAMQQPGFNGNQAAPVARALQFNMVKGGGEEEQQGAYEFMKFFTRAEQQAKWSMETGYVAVRQSVTENEDFKAFAAENPQILVPLEQSMHASILPIDPTGGKVYDALKIAADKVEIENVPAKEALDEAQKTAQEALDALQ